jgi:hypothetical protein
LLIHSLDTISPSRSFLSPFLAYFRAPAEEIYYLDDAGLDEIREAMTSREEKRKGRLWDSGFRDGGLLVEGGGDWRGSGVWG